MACFLLLSACGNDHGEKDIDRKDSLKKSDNTEAVAGDTAQKTSTRPWIFDQSLSDEADEPVTQVSVVIDHRSYVVSKRVMGNMNLLEKNIWKEYKIPDKANTACMSWWAGEGDIFYLIKKKDRYQVLHAKIGEGMDLEKDISYKTVLDVSGNTR